MAQKKWLLENMTRLYIISISHISKWFKKMKRDDKEYWFQRLFNEGKELISPELEDDWKKTVSNNLSSILEVMEVIHYLKELKEIEKTKNPSEAFTVIANEFHHENHSGSVAFWILSCLEHFGGEYGRILSWQLQKHLL